MDNFKFIYDNCMLTWVLGSIVISDCWRAYNGLEAEGYTHWKVNHSIEFVSPTDPRVHTNSIEGTWRCVKLSLPQQRYRTVKLHIKNKAVYTALSKPVNNW